MIDCTETVGRTDTLDATFNLRRQRHCQRGKHRSLLNIASFLILHPIFKCKRVNNSLCECLLWCSKWMEVRGRNSFKTSSMMAFSVLQGSSEPCAPFRERSFSPKTCGLTVRLTHRFQLASGRRPQRHIASAHSRG